MNDPRINLPEESKPIATKLTDAIVEALLAAKFQSPNIDSDDLEDAMLFEQHGGGYGVLEDIQQQMTPDFRIEVGEENITELMWPVTEKTFRLYVHFKVIKAVGVDPTPMIKYYFGRITETLVTPEHFAGIALDISEVGNAPQAQGVNDPEPGGSIWFDVEYRHGYGNYFSETGNGD